MNQVLVILRILPKDIDINLQELKEDLKRSITSSGFKVMKLAEEPIAFGLKALRAVIIMPEKEAGGTTPLEEAILKTRGVEEVEVEYVTRI